MSQPDLVVLVGRHVVRARGLVAGARGPVAACRDVPWVAAAAAAYRAAVDEVVASLAALLRRLDAVLDALGLAAGAAPPTMGEVLSSATCRGQAGRALRVGGDGYVSVDPAALADAAGRLAAVAGTLGEAQAELAATQWWPGQSGLLGLPDPLAAVRPVLRDLVRGASGPGGIAGTLGDLATTTRAAAQVAADGESTTQRRVRAVASLAGSALGDDPLLALFLGVRAVETGATVAAVGGIVAAVAPGLGRAMADEGRRALTSAVAAGAVEDAVTGLAAGVRSLLLPGPQLPVARPVRDAAPLLALPLGPAAPVTVGAEPDPPQPPPPAGVGDLVGLVALSDDRPGGDGSAAAPVGTVTVQRLDHADGSRSWVVAVPGTQTWMAGGSDPLDGESDLQQVAGLADSVTVGVLGAMAAAGIPDDEPVVLVGHSLGGMAVMSVAAVATAAGTYRVAGVVTAGAPTVGRAVPESVPLVRLEHDEDPVPQLDGEPTPVEGDVSRVRRAMGDTPRAHWIEQYELTGRLLDQEVAAAPGSAPGVEAVTAALGGDGTTAETMRFQVTRDGAAADAASGAGAAGGAGAADEGAASAAVPGAAAGGW